MKRLGTAIALGIVLIAGTSITATTQAMPVDQLNTGANSLVPLERAQLFIFGGRHYCFYLDGWHGPAGIGAAMLGDAVLAGEVPAGGTVGILGVRGVPAGPASVLDVVPIPDPAPDRILDPARIFGLEDPVRTVVLAEAPVRMITDADAHALT